MSDENALVKTQPSSIYSNVASFESAQRMAASLADSKLVPIQYQGQAGLSNCIVAMEIANRMGMSAFQVMQNLNVIHGRPSWSSQFIIGLIQSSARFSGFTYVETSITEDSSSDDSCQCIATLKETGELVTGTKITMQMAKDEGWTKNSKWRTMPQTMLRYRAASSFGRFHIPDLILGMQSVEENEVIDVQVDVAESPPAAPSTTLDRLNEKLSTPKTDPEPVSEDADDFFD